jgi:predicted RNase H-like HicB family nuclease
MKILAVIEKGKDGLYSVYTDAEIANHCFGGFGESAEIAKDDFKGSIEEAKQAIMEETGTIPPEFNDLRIEFKYDLESFFNYFDWINVSKFATAAGINESKMRQYKSGIAFASEKTKNKILKTIKKLSAELSAASL